MMQEECPHLRMVGAPQFRGAAETTGLRMLRSGMLIPSRCQPRLDEEVVSADLDEPAGEEDEG